MYGDTDVLRRHVDRLREQADDIRSAADELVARTESLTWSGRAADSMRFRVSERATHLRGSAAQHDAAADSLDRHLQEVDGAKDSIASIEQRVTALAADARTRVAQTERAAKESGLAVEPDADDVRLASFAAPPPGHRDWLAVELPGL